MQLEIAYAPKLQSLDEFTENKLGLREFDLTNCKKITSYSPISDLEFLRTLRLSSCSAIPDLRWVQGLNRLDFFSFVDTNVIDGDLTPLLDLPCLRYVGSLAKRHYQPHIDEINKRLDPPQRNQ